MNILDEEEKKQNLFAEIVFKQIIIFYCLFFCNFLYIFVTRTEEEEELHFLVVGLAFDINFLISLLVILFVFVFVFEHRRLQFWMDIRVHAQFITFEYRLRTYPESGQGWLQKTRWWYDYDMEMFSWYHGVSTGWAFTYNIGEIYFDKVTYWAVGWTAEKYHFLGKWYFRVVCWIFLKTGKPYWASKHSFFPVLIN